MQAGAAAVGRPLAVEAQAVFVRAAAAAAAAAAAVGSQKRKKRRERGKRNGTPATALLETVTCQVECRC